MKRVIVDYSKLTGEILNLLVEKFPDGYDDSDIVRFKNAKNETIEAVEVRTVDTIFLVKISMKLSDRIINYDEDDELADDDDIEDDSIDALKELEIDEDENDDDDDVSEKAESSGNDDDNDDNDDDDNDSNEEEDLDDDDDDE
ncbi:DNA primase [Flavobacterium sp.]|uniref:DNA primase n=1 Tax=Flavobacterium sp. TaxID=239 RepID=UPI00286B8838|nr:DNA primase [Flavobacterium sp.]